MRSADQVADAAIKASKKSGKVSAEDVVEKSIAVLQARDKTITKQDVADAFKHFQNSIAKKQKK